MSEIPTMTHQSPIKRVMSQRNFALLWAGQSTSLLGDQFYMVATPWLVLKLTGDPLALGTVLAVGAVPRAAMILIGGAITDRLSARTIMITSDLIRLALTLCMVFLLVSGGIQLWMLYVLSFCFGVVSGFFIPASNSIVPAILTHENLQAGNSVFQGSSQLVGFIGPGLAGVVIGAFSGETKGITLAFVIDAVTFMVSVATLWLMKLGYLAPAMKAGENVWNSIKTGIGYAWKDSSLKFGFLLIAFANLFFSGPIVVGIPVLADQRLPEGAAAFGLILSAFAGGNLLGIILCGVLPSLSAKRLKYLLIGTFTLFGVGLVGLGLITATWMGFVLMFLLGIGNGYLSIVLITGIQRRTPKELMGRLMSLMLLANIGLMPLSQTIAGALSRWNLTGLLALSGGSILLLTVWMLLQPGLTQMAARFSDQSLVEEAPTHPPAGVN